MGKNKKKGTLHVAILIGMDKKGGKKPKKLSQGGSLTHMGNAFPDATTDSISRGGGDEISGIKFRGVK